MTSDRVLKESRILIIDDTQPNVRIVERMLDWSGYSNVRSTTSSTEALAIFPEYEPDLIILDLHMPGLSGYQVMETIRAQPQGEFVPILVFTADVTAEARQKALHLGASDFLTKPGDATEISLRVRNFLNTRHLHREIEEKNAELETKVAQRTKALWTSQVEILERLGRIAALRGDTAGEHASAVGELSAKIATCLGWSNTNVELIRLAAPLMDIGKLTLPDSLVCKAGKLTQEEAQSLKQHASRGAQVLCGGRTPLLEMAEQIARHHHETWDGMGYPLGLGGDQIPEAARVAAVADAFSTLVGGSAARAPLSADEAVLEIQDGSGTLFDPAVVAAFLRALGRSSDGSSAKAA